MKHWNVSVVLYSGEISYNWQVPTQRCPLATANLNHGAIYIIPEIQQA